MKKAFAGLGLLMFVAGCVPPQGVTQENLQAFDNAVFSLGCRLADEGDYLAVALQTGIPRARLQEVAEYRVTWDGGRRLNDGSFQLTSGRCAHLASTPA